MPKANNGKKIESVRNKVLIGFAILCILTAVLSIYVLFAQNGRLCLKVPQRDHCTLLETATSVETRAKGLSGRAVLPRNQGMLFIFESPGNHCFWMKDMRFAIDIVWLNQAREVVQIKERVQPSSYPEAFCSAERSSYGIELNAGQAAAHGIKVGQTLRF